MDLDLNSISSEFLIKIVTACTAFYFLIRFLGLWKKSRNYPPGPVGLPFVGYLPFLTDQPHLKFQQLRKKYGNVFSLYLGPRYTVVLSDVETLRDCLNREEFHGRPSTSVLGPFDFHTGISTVNGRDWAEQRKLVFHALRGAGKGNEFVEHIVKNELDRFLHRIADSKGKPICIKERLSTSVSNILTTLALAKSYDHDSKEREFLNHCIQEIVVHSSQTDSQTYLPWLTSTPIVNKYGGWEEYRKLLKKLKEFFEEEIKEHERTLDPNNVSDFIDAYLVQQIKAKEQGQYACYTRDHLLGTLFTLFAAGSETVRTSLQWMFYALVAFPEVRSKIQKEIDEVLGREREPEWSDQKDMPYCLSVIMEVQRLFTIVPMNIYRYTTEDTKIGSYDIPKGTVVLSNLWSVLRDPEHWEKPNDFIPERFLDESGKNVVKHKSYLPFSFGKRICPGEALSMVEMFLFLTSTLQKYDIRLPEGQTVSLKPEYYVTSQPETQEVCFVDRV